MEIGTVQQVDIEQEMQVAYLDYAMSVIVARALPDVRDGLKPVHRRIMYAMHDMGLRHESPYKKSARIVGEVLGKYHPHGDAAVYESMVRMAQDFSMRYLLVDGQGNFGSIDGDSAAAMRYTEARQQALSEEMLADINKNTVDFGPNFDGSLKEPLVLPAAFPNLIVNGSSGIAVGMATNIPPHNLSEVCDALSYVIDNYKRVDEIGVEELMKFIQGPDFPTGGIVYTNESGENGKDDADAEDPLRTAYASGRGRITVQARAHIEEMSRNRNRIVVTELPYQTNKSRLIERIAELVRDGRIEGITDLRDESDRQGMRMIIELTRNVDPKQMLRELFRLTPMRSTFIIMLLALVDGEPRVLSLRRMLFHYIEHRREIITRRSQYDLERARERAHILEGLLIALDNLDEVIQIIRRSRTAETAHTNLCKRFKLTDLQAQAILDMPLRRLAALERQKIEQEYKEKLDLIAYLQDLLAHPAKILAVIKDNLGELKKKYGDGRRTQIVRGTHHEMVTGASVPDEENVVVIRGDGLVCREPEKRRYLLAVGQGNNVPQHLVLTNTRDTLVCFTTDGRALPVPAHTVPHIESNEQKSIKDFISAGRDDGLAYVLSMPMQESDDEEDGGTKPIYLLTVTKVGKIKRTLLADVRKALARGETSVMNVDKEDSLIWAALTPGEREIILISNKSQAIRFNEEEVRATGLGAGGVMAIKMGDKDSLIGAGLFKDTTFLLTVSQKGYGKISALSAYPAQKRYGAGIVAAKIDARTGPLVTAAIVDEDEQIILLTAKGTGKRIKIEAFAKMGRSSLGKPVTELPPNEAVTGSVQVTDALSEFKEEEKSTAVTPPEKPAAEESTGSTQTKATGRAGASTRTTSKGKTTATGSIKGQAANEDGADSAAPAKPATKTRTTRKPKAAAPTVQAKETATKAQKDSGGTAKQPVKRQATGRTGPTSQAKAQPTQQDELDLPVPAKRPASRKASASTRQARPAEKGSPARAKAEPLKDTRSQMPLPLEEEELDLPAPAKKPRRQSQPASKTGKSGKTATDGKAPRRISSTRPKSDK